MWSLNQMYNQGTGKCGAIIFVEGVGEGRWDEGGKLTSLRYCSVCGQNFSPPQPAGKLGPHTGAAPLTSGFDKCSPSTSMRGRAV